LASGVAGDLNTGIGERFQTPVQPWPLQEFPSANGLVAPCAVAQSGQSMAVCHVARSRDDAHRGFQGRWRKRSVVSSVLF
jgi:hypothetical protein